MIEPFAERDLQPVEQSEDHQGGDPLRRRRHVEDRSHGQFGRQRLDDLGLEPLEIAKPQGRALSLQKGRMGLCETAAIGAVQPLPGKRREGLGKCRLLQDAALCGRLAAGQIDIGKARHVLQPAELGAGAVALIAGDDDPVPGIGLGSGEKFAEREASVFGHHLQSLCPAGDGAGHGQRRQSAPRRNGIAVPVLLIEFGRRERRRAATGGNADRRLARLLNDPEPVAANRVHMGIDDGDRRRRRNHRLDRRPAFGQNVATGKGGGQMRGADAAIEPRCGMQHGKTSFTSRSRRAAKAPSTGRDRRAPVRRAEGR